MVDIGGNEIFPTGSMFEEYSKMSVRNKSSLLEEDLEENGDGNIAG